MAKRKRKRGNDYPLENLFGQILSPFERFLQRTTSGGIILIGTTLVALILANSMWGDYVRHLWEQPLHIGIGAWQLKLSLHSWINEGLMTFFFLLVGLELKRQILVGELASFRDALLPAAAAIGGMLMPALIYYVLNPDGPTARGWGIPTATDIAFAVGILVLLAWRIPANLIIFLTALAIVDDLGAVLIIAIFYTHDISLIALGSAAGIFFLLILLNQGGIRHPLPYGLLGIVLWVTLLKSGIHATIAGVLLAFTIPARPAFTLQHFEQRLTQLQSALHSEVADPDACEHALGCPDMATVAENLESAARAVQSPQQHMEHTLSPWVTFLVIPLFALSNAAIDFHAIELGQTLSHPVTMGVMLGLVLGKFIGISCFSWLAIRLRIARLPAGVGWCHLFGAAWLAGIGFTMSLFIGQLAFKDPVLVEQAKLGILFASLVAAVIGLMWLLLAKSPLGDESSRARDERSAD
jgi:Na+:H+ antiporter, NhaA family